MIETPYLYFENLVDLMPTIAPDSITSRTIYKDKQFKAVLFGFDEGQSLSEHSASQAAVIQIVRGDASVTLGGDTLDVSAGAWLHLPPQLKHSVVAKTPLVLLLLLIV